MNNRIELAIDFLERGQPFTIRNLRLEMEGKTRFAVIGWSQYLTFTNLTKANSTEELSQIKNIFSELLEDSQELKKFAADKSIEFRLYFNDGGKASIEIYSEKNGIITCGVDLK
jgi:hypothetical protein